MEAVNPSHACASVIVDELARCGVTDAVLSPGSRSAALAMVLHDDPRIRLHVELDERSAGFLALGLGRATGRCAPVVVTSGSAVANLYPAVIEADTGMVPMLLLTADRPAELQATGANQTIDQVGLFGGSARWSADPGVPEDLPTSVPLWRATVCRALATAHGVIGVPGPVHINLRFREPTVPLADDGRSPEAQWIQPLDGRKDGRPWVEVRQLDRTPAARQLADLTGRILETERGLVVVGATDADPGTIHDFARAAGWPVVAESISGARTVTTTISTGHHLLSHPGFARAHAPELVVRIGRITLSSPLARFLSADVPQVAIDPHGSWHDPERVVAQLLVADVGATLRVIADQLVETTRSSWSDQWQRADTTARAVIDRILDGHDAPTEPRVARDLGAALPDGATLVVASSMPVRDLDLYLAPRHGLRVIANRGVSGIDGFVSTAMGVALGSVGPTVALTGDLSFLHDANGLLVAADAQQVDLTFVIVDNDGGGIFSFLPQAGFPASFERIFATPHGRDLAQLAQFHRLDLTTVTRAADLADAVTEAIDAGGVQVIHLRTDRHANVALHHQITSEVAAALEG